MSPAFWYQDLLQVISHRLIIYFYIYKEKKEGMANDEHRERERNLEGNDEHSLTEGD